MKILTALMNYLMLAAFALSAAVQINDPDPLAWMLLYGLAAGACLLFATGRLHFGIAFGLAAVAFVWGLLLLPGTLASQQALSPEAVFGSSDMKNERVELVREIGGLGLVAIWMVVLGIIGFRARSRD